MGQLADAINKAAQAVPTGPVTDEADLLNGPELLSIFAAIVEAVAALELQQAGSQILWGTAAPDDHNGNDHDLYLNVSNGDLYGKDGGAWSRLVNLRGPRGLDGRPGDPGQRGRDGKPGAPGADGQAGQDGQNGAAGRDGNRVRLFTAAPAAADGNDGDVAIVTSTGSLEEKVAGAWVVRGSFSGGGGTGTVKSVNGVQPDANGNVTIMAGGSNTPVDGDLAANPTSTTRAASVAAVVNALTGKVDKVDGKALSTNDYTTADKNKLGALRTGVAGTNIVYDDSVAGQRTVSVAASPYLGGVPTVDTAPLTANSLQIANAAFVQGVVSAAINALVAGAPAALDTLVEIATKLSQDDNKLDSLLGGIQTNTAAIGALARYRGDYTGGVAVNALDTMYYQGGLWAANTAHTTSGTFTVANWTLALGESYLDSTHSANATIALDFARTSATVRVVTVDTAGVTLTFTTTNRSRGRTKQVDLTNTSSGSISLSLAGWKTFGTVPTSLAAGKTLLITLTCPTSTDSESAVRAGFILSN